MDKQKLIQACSNKNQALIDKIMTEDENNAVIDKNLDFYIKRLLIPIKDSFENAPLHETGLIASCAFGDVELVKYFLSSPTLKKHANPHYGGNIAFRMAMRHENVDIIDYLLKNTDLKIKDNDLTSCSFVSIEMLDYVFNSPHLKKHTLKKRLSNVYFQRACENGQMEVINYLLHCDDIKHHIDIYRGNYSQPFFHYLFCLVDSFFSFDFNKDCGFLAACTQEQTEVVRFLILDKKIKKSYRIVQYLKKNRNEFSIEVENIFARQHLYQKLQKTFKNSSSKTKLNKL